MPRPIVLKSNIPVRGRIISLNAVESATNCSLLAGAVLHYTETGSLAFNAFHETVPGEGLFKGLGSTGTVLIFLGFGIKAAFPLLHNWVQDAYPESTPSGTVFLSTCQTLALRSLILPSSISSVASSK